ncbi:MAG TPA: DNA-processing protein DprA [Candidatus Bathyarchaeia archaeon]|nr:DNA-processing protein DprA [Candidatus Bathyarchaeia archaeon]
MPNGNFDLDEERLYWLAFSVFVGIGPKRFALLKNYFGSAKKAWQANPNELTRIGLGSLLSRQLAEFRKKFDPLIYYRDLRRQGFNCLFLDQLDYPENLVRIESPPFVLYVWGQIEKKDRLALAVVGTRKMTGYGGQVTESLVTDLAAAGLTIVSGLARGVDSMAHQSVLSAGGRTIAVLGSSLDWIYPRENQDLARKIAAGRGAVISEYPLGTQPYLGNFPARNRIISGLSLGTLVVEGGEKSGSLITARLAAEQGREVFAVPGPIYNPGTKGPAYLVRLGAKLVLSVDDILEELNLGTRKGTSEKQPILSDSAEESLLLTLLEKEAKHIDQLVRESGLTTAQVTSLMTMMEIKGKIKDMGGLVYIIKK